jgi:hypothetical protein
MNVLFWSWRLYFSSCLFVLDLPYLCSYLNEHEDANSKAKHSTMNIETATPSENIQLGT